MSATLTADQHGGPGPSTSTSRAKATGHAFTLSANVTPAQKDALSELLSKKQPPSCDACRTRKLKCSGRPTMIEIGPEAVATVPCDNCREWSLDCCYLYQRKRRGRKNRVVERLAKEQKARKSNGGAFSPSSGEDEPDQSEDWLKSMLSTADQSVSPTHTRAAPASSIQSWQLSSTQDQRPNTSIQPDTNASMDLSFLQNPVIDHQKSSTIGSTGRNPSITTFPKPHEYSTGPLTNASMILPASHQPQNHFPSDPSPQAAINDPSPSIALSDASTVRYATIASVLPRDLAMKIIELFFGHVFCIIPVIHRPTFYADLANHEEERRPMLLALICSMIALTLLHIPRTFFPSLHGDQVRHLSDHCLKVAYTTVRREANAITLDLICIKYFSFVIHNIHGSNGLEASAFGEGIALAIALGLHREDSYVNLNPIEAERRRRVWFLFFNADKFEAIFRGKPVILTPDEFIGPESTELPTELDDKSITLNGYNSSSSPTPLICGFNIMTRLVTIIGELLIHARDTRRKPPHDPEGVLTALREVRRMQSRVKHINDTLPMPFKLETVNTTNLPAPGWEEIMRDQLDNFFQDPMASETAKDGYLVLKANIHVTLAMTRLRIILHREDLLNLSGLPGSSSRNAAELVAADLGESSDWRLSVYQALFNAVHGIPIQALAANGPSLVNKIRVVAVTLIDALPAQDYSDVNVQGIVAYLVDFLNIMTSIESQFTD